MFFKALVFQGPGFSESRFFRVQVFQSPGFQGPGFQGPGSRFRVQVSGVALFRMISEKMMKSGSFFHVEKDMDFEKFNCFFIEFLR